MEIFKPADFEGWAEDPTGLCEDINYLLKKRLNVGYFDDDDVEHDGSDECVIQFYPNIQGEKCDDELAKKTFQHKMYYYAEPLEEEKPKCDHAFGIVYKNDGEKVTVNHSYCPDCGEKL